MGAPLLQPDRAPTTATRHPPPTRLPGAARAAHPSRRSGSRPTPLVHGPVQEGHPPGPGRRVPLPRPLIHCPVPPRDLSTVQTISPVVVLFDHYSKAVQTAGLCVFLDRHTPPLPPPACAPGGWSRLFCRSAALGGQPDWSNGLIKLTGHLVNHLVTQTLTMSPGTWTRVREGAR